MRTILITAAFAALCSTAVYAADAKAGKEVYDKSCKSCHGADGTPNAAVAKMKKVEMKDFKTTDLSDANIKTAITAGKGKMSAVASVTGASVDNVVAYVKSLKK
jgi:mono/diheme cytochrome c family protein